MSLENEQKIVFENIIDELKNVQFNKLEKVSEKYKIKFDNILTAREINEKGFIIEAKRRLYFEPYGAFEITVEYDITCVFDKKTKEFYKGNIKEISKFIEKRKIEIFNSLDTGNMMTMIIAQITQSIKNPILLPPFINIEE